MIRFAYSAIFLLFFLPLLFCADDNIETLISNEKRQIESWMKGDEEEPLPPAFFLGDENNIELYSDMVAEKWTSPLCELLQLDDLIPLSGGNLEQEKVRVNFTHPRVREKFSEGCYIRPGDLFFAITQGGNFVINLQDFFIVNSRLRCHEVSPFLLTATFSGPLKDQPLFFSTDLNVKEGPNQFKPSSSLASVPLRPEISSKLKALIPFFEEFEIRVIDIKAANVDQILHLNRKSISLDDVGLPNEILFWVKGDKVEEMVQETVEKEAQSGHVKVVGSLDYNQDGRADLIVDGDQGGCPYRLMFEGQEEGLILIPLPNRICSC